jgi:hypothetical protein
MKASELRLGNYVYSQSCNCNFPKGIIQVDFEAFRKIHLFNGLSGLEPIELTEEWLLKFGFTRMYKLYSLNNVNIFKLNSEFISDLDVPVQHVHQLQNLYFALTNQELTYTP